jgi:asparagine synthase (glutamine-hydrolysing)
VADALGIDSVVVTQDHSEFSSWYRSTDREQYAAETNQIDALPTIGTVVAVQKAASDELIPSDSVIVTGDSASTTGEHIPPSLYSRRRIGVDRLVSEILDAHYTFWEFGDDLELQLRDRIRSGLDVSRDSSRAELIRESERWDWRERQAKHILRDHVFDFYGFNWWLPLWDTEFMSFWDDVPAEHRYQRSLHEAYEEQLFMEVAESPSEEATRLFEDGGGLVSKIGSLIDGTVLEKTAHDLHRNYFFSTDYGDNPVFGIMSKNQFNYLTARIHTPHSLRSLEVVSDAFLYASG